MLNVKSVKEIFNRLKAQRKTVAIAESCTGGYLSHLFTTFSGSSAYFCGSVVAYHVSVKEKLLSVSPETIKKYGVVSRQVAMEMAQGARGALQADIGLATTGMVESENTVNSVWVGFSSGSSSFAKLFKVRLSREENIKYASLCALEILENSLALNSE